MQLNMTSHLTQRGGSNLPLPVATPLILYLSLLSVPFLVLQHLRGT